MANVKMTATNIYLSGQTTTKATGCPAYFMDNTICTPTEVMNAAAAGQQVLSTLLDSKKKISGTVSSSTTSLTASGYTANKAYSLYLVVTNTDLTEVYISALKTGTTARTGTTTVNVGDQKTNSQKAAIAPGGTVAARWYIVTPDARPVYINGTQIEKFMFNGIEVEHFYINGNEIF